MCLIENEKVGDNYIYITYIYKFNTQIIFFLNVLHYNRVKKPHLSLSGLFLIVLGIISVGNVVGFTFSQFKFLSVDFHFTNFFAQST